MKRRLLHSLSHPEVRYSLFIRAFVAFHLLTNNYFFKYKHFVTIYKALY